MNANEKLEYALDKTFIKYPNYANPLYINKVALNIYLSIKSKKNMDYITRDGGARNYASSLSSKEIIIYFIDNLIKLYGSLISNYPELISGEGISNSRLKEIEAEYGAYKDIIKIFLIMENIDANLITYYQTHDNQLLDLITVVMKSSFSPSIYLSGITKTKPQYGNAYRLVMANDAKKNAKSKALLNKLNEDIKFYQNIEDIRFNPIAINRCHNEVINGSQIMHKHNEYKEGECLFASQDIGKKRNTQEDSVIIMEHPRNNKYKLIAVCDGVGGIDAGEVASNMVAKELANVFSNMDPNLFLEADKIVPFIENLISNIASNVAQSTRGLSTLTGAIVCEDKTIIMNVGDSRVYTIKGNTIQQQTDDDSLVYKLLQMEKDENNVSITLDDISDLRFKHSNNVICNAIGANYNQHPQVFTIPNDYDKLLAMSDGVHDILSWMDIYTIASTTTDPEYIASNIVNAANNKTVKQDEVIIPAGKDNISVAAFVRR